MGAFYGALDAERAARGITWKRAALEAGVPPSTVSRMSRGSGADADTLAALAVWSGLRLDDFVRAAARPRKARAPKATAAANVAAYLLRDGEEAGLSRNAALALAEIVRVGYLRLKGS